MTKPIITNAVNENTNIVYSQKVVDDLLAENKRLEKENDELKEKVNNYRLYGSPTVIQPNNHTNTEFDLLCQKNENLEQENEQLKAENDRQKDTIIYLQNYDMCHKTLIQYKQALEEIREIAKNACKGCTSECDCIIDDEPCKYYGFYHIRELIDEVLK